jgi:hypothetical protein
MGAKRKKFEVERDQNFVTEYYLKGFSARIIAMKISEKVGNDENGEPYKISHVTVLKDINFLLSQWYSERIHDITNQKLIELTKIDKLEQTYWDAWEKSVENHRKITNKAKGAVGSKNPNYQEITETEIREFGEVRFLQGVDKCIERRCKLLGLDAPVKMEHQDNSFLAFLMQTE